MSILNKYKINRVLFHILFWVLSILAFAFIFKLSDSISRLDIIYSIFFHIAVFTGVYLNFFGIKKWVIKNCYFRYSVFAITIIAFAAFLNHYTFEVLVDLVLPDYYFVSQFNFGETAVIITVYLIITTATKLSKSWFELQRMNQRMVKEEKEKLDSELHNLKAQINPHFLFNSLNVIYSLALKNDKLTAEVVLKLSDILRYVIYDSTQDKVTLDSEVSLLKKYIELQKYRVEDSAAISFISNVEEDVKIAPLIFLTLVENSFKHGIKSDTENVFINITLNSDAEKITFEIENNKSKTNTNSSNPNGLGLENIKRRLMIQYPDRHKFEVYDSKDTFKVCLEIEHEKS
jgi:LytS/YehU family sensor histidine kinase